MGKLFLRKGKGRLIDKGDLFETLPTGREEEDWHIFVFVTAQDTPADRIVFEIKEAGFISIGKLASSVEWIKVDSKIREHPTCEGCGRFMVLSNY